MQRANPIAWRFHFARFFALTPVGEHFYRKSLVLIADFERLCHKTVRIANQDNAELRIGYLKCYGGQEFHLAVAEFSEKYPDVSVQIVNANHEELYDALRSGGIDLVFNDQRRAFSHYDPAMVEWFVKTVEERKTNQDSAKEKKSW